ncbi:LysE family translocator [Pseudomonas botevensis]|uniref:LysE family translocator n=1 Tax=Pseudomonas botevensis TaxID=2842352 RepID=UPI001C3C80AA|nr:LysE family translocator [Pseudomonas botevensis]MBV4473489.1 LysE family translocator [Pseudomonas botevensis]
MLSTLPTLLPFLLFAFVASITPGPTNILVFSNSARYGLTAALPIILGACAAAALLVLAVGSGAGPLLTQLPGMQHAMQAFGVAWLSYLAWQIYRAPAVELGAQESRGRLGLTGAAGLQLVNPKTWMMALAVVSVFAGDSEGRVTRVLILSLAFFLVSLPCLGMWALLGAGSTRWLRSPRALQRLNRVMAVLLLVSAWSSIWA